MKQQPVAAMLRHFHQKTAEGVHAVARPSLEIFVSFCVSEKASALVLNRVLQPLQPVYVLLFVVKKVVMMVPMGVVILPSFLLAFLMK
jgi:hypothetical protein